MKHFIFDMGGVLFKQIDIALKKDEPSFVKLETPEIEKKFRNNFNELQKGIITDVEFAKIMAPHFNKKGLTPGEYKQNYIDIYNKSGEITPHSVEMLKELKQSGYKVYLLSNLHEMDFDFFSKLFDVSIFDRLFLSYKMHMIKPDDEIYKAVIKEIGDDPKTMCFFDDRKENVDAAIQNGMNALITTGDNLKQNIELAKNIN